MSDKTFKLYIANTKMQNEQFGYRVPLSTGTLSPLRIQEIPSGSQIQTSGELSQSQVDEVIRQHQAYGLISLEDAGRHRGYVGLIYSLGKPIPSDVIVALMRGNHQVLDEKGRRMREEAAVATAVGLETQLQGDGAPRLGEMTVEVEEVRTKTSDTDETAPQRIRVSRDSEPSKGTKKGS